jgi:hypothetical protein
VSGEKVDVTGATVETQEGKTYPVTVHRVEPNFYDYQAKEIDFSRIPKVIPPHFRWTRLGSSGEEVGYAPLGETYGLSMGEYYLRFRFATAAHPTRVVFPKRPDWNINLGSATQTNISFPAEASFINSKPMSALAGKVLADDPSGLLVTLDGTGTMPSSSQVLELQYTIVNRDKLDAHKANITFPILAVFFGDGAVSPATSGLGTESVEAGPGQTTKKGLFLGYLFMDRECNPNVYALVQEGSQYNIYWLNVCK